MPKDRGMEHIERYFGNFTKLVADKIKKKGKVNDRIPVENVLVSVFDKRIIKKHTG